jgi:hypothetical protein
LSIIRTVLAAAGVRATPAIHNTRTGQRNTVRASSVEFRVTQDYPASFIQPDSGWLDTPSFHDLPPPDDDGSDCVGDLREPGKRALQRSIVQVCETAYPRPQEFIVDRERPVRVHGADGVAVIRKRNRAFPDPTVCPDQEGVWFRRVADIGWRILVRARLALTKGQGWYGPFRFLIWQPRCFRADFIESRGISSAQFLLDIAQLG